VDKPTKAIVIAIFLTITIGAVFHIATNRNVQNNSFSNKKDFFVELDGVRISLGTPLATILPYFSLHSVIARCLDSMLYPQHTEFVELYSQNIEEPRVSDHFTIRVQNVTGEPIPVRDGEIRYIALFSNASNTFESHTLVDGMQFGVTTLREVRRTYGRPHTEECNGMFRSLIYLPTYRYEGYSSSRFHMTFCNDTGLLNGIMLTYRR